MVAGSTHLPLTKEAVSISVASDTNMVSVEGDRGLELGNRTHGRAEGQVAGGENWLRSSTRDVGH